MTGHPIEIFYCEQNSPEWDALRAGLVTASELQCIIAASSEKKGRKSYMERLAGEIITGAPAENFSNHAMARGHLMEDEVRRNYGFMNDVEPKRIGFVRKGRVGCSPDSFIGEDGVLEIKTAAPAVLIPKLDKDEFPNEHKAQCQGILWITGREWVEIEVAPVVRVPTAPGEPWAYRVATEMRSLVKRAYREEAYIANLARETAAFISELDAMVARHKVGQRAAA